MERFDSETLQRLMERLPMEYREVPLLREVEDLSYKPGGTQHGPGALPRRSAWPDSNFYQA
jgi:hypothetical protein